MKKKSRNLSMVEFLTILQQEYVVAELRRKIYKKKEYSFYTKLMDGKKQKIEDIANRNNLATIFNDRETNNTIHYSIYHAFGFPNFVYRNNEDRNQRERKDFYYYYKVESNVRIRCNNSTFDRLGVVVSADFESQQVKVRTDNTTAIYSCDLVSRIF